MNSVRDNLSIRKKSRSEGSQKGQISQALVMINLYLKFNVHSSYAKQVIVLKVVDRRTDRAPGDPGDNNGHRPKFWLRPKKLPLLRCPRRL